MFADTVVAENRLKNPLFLAGIALAIAAVIWLLNPTVLMQRLLEQEDDIGQMQRVIVSGAVAGAIAINLLVLSLLPRMVQRVLVYAELFAIVLAFAAVFDLDFAFIVEKLPYMVSQGVVTTLYVSAISIVIAFCVAMLAAIAKLSTSELARSVATFYTSVFRGLPLLMQLFLIYLGLPQLGFNITALPAGIIALSLYYGAYMTEIFRAGIMSIPQGQWEASRALGFGFGRTMMRIILPQAVPVVVPPTGNMFIAILKDSSLVSVIGIWELMYLSRNLGSATFNHMEMLLTAAAIYWILTIILEIGQSKLERHYSRSSSR